MRKKILVIEDEQEMAWSLKRKLERANYLAILAFDGKKGLDLALRYPVDLIVTDVVMPMMNGVELCKELKKVESLTDVPILVLTAWGRLEDVFQEIGVNGFLTKPFDGRELINKISDLLKEGKKNEAEPL